MIPLHQDLMLEHTYDVVEVDQITTELIDFLNKSFGPPGSRWWISVIVHRFKMGDVEDPDLYAAQPLWEWQQSEMGAWVMEHSVETPMWHRQANPNQYHTDYAVQAWLKGADYTFWVLKWADHVDALT